MQIMKEQVEHILAQNVTYDISADAVGKILDKWQENKSEIINMLGGPIYTSPEPVTIVRTHDELSIIWNDFIEDLRLYRFYTHLIHVNALVDFLKGQGMENFFKNETASAYTFDGKDIPKGMKISRALKTFIPDKGFLNKIQSRYSMILQDVQITGYLHLSAHPLDYLSVSENTYNWHSCHALDGEYAGGNLNYMTDKTTIVAYLSGKKNYILPRFGDVEWNSKKWRAIIYMGESHSIICKGYPFKSDNLSEQVSDMLASLRGGTWTKPKVIKDRTEARALCFSTEDGMFFNDALLSTSHRGYVTTNEETFNPDDIRKIKVGEPVPCLCCNLETATVADEFTCRECCNYAYCVCCEEAVCEGDEYYFDGEIYCEYCYLENVNCCVSCHDEDYADGDYVFYRDDLGDYYCDACYNEAISEMEENEYE